MTREARLGLFVLIGLISLVVTIILLGDFQFQRHYYLHIMFNNVAGLPSRAKAKIAGVDVGAVKEITLDGSKARVTIWVDSDVRIHADAEARIVATGIIGSKYLELTAGSSLAPVLKNNDTIIGIDPIQFDKVIQKVMEQLDGVMGNFKGGEVKGIITNLSKTMENLEEITTTLKGALEDQEERLSETIANFHSFSKDMAAITSENRTDIRDAVEGVKRITDRLDHILAQVEKGEGTIGKLMADEEMGKDLKATFSDLKETTREAKRVMKRINLIETHWDYTLRYDHRSGYTRNDAGLRILPRPEKFYFVGASNLGDKSTDPNDPEEKNTLNFYLGKQNSIVQYYAGVIRSKGGVGVKVRPGWKWSPWNRLEVTAEGYDFGRKTPVAKARVNIGGRVQITKWGFLGAQVEDIYNVSSVNTYMNVAFRDDDIAYILGLVGLAKP